jgi:hypothetical protein
MARSLPVLCAQAAPRTARSAQPPAPLRPGYVCVDDKNADQRMAEHSYWAGNLAAQIGCAIYAPMSKMEEMANVLDNSHARGNLCRTRNQRLLAGRVLIFVQRSVRSTARRLRQSAGFLGWSRQARPRRESATSGDICTVIEASPGPWPSTSE